MPLFLQFNSQLIISIPERALHVEELDVGADESAFKQAIDCDGGNFKNVKIFQITL